MKMSKSRALLYIKCPKNFYIDYVLGARKFKEDPPEGSPLTIGTDLHKIFEDFYKLPESDDIDVPYEDNIYSILMSMLEEMAEEKKEAGRDYKQCLELYPPHLRHFANFNARIIKDKGMKKYKPVDQELDLYDKGLDFQGIIDRIDENPDKPGTYIITDYKTGKMKALHHYQFELGLYKVLYERSTGREVSKAGIYFSKNNKPRYLDMTDEHVEEALSTLKQIRREIDYYLERKIPFERKEQFLCRFCDHENRLCRESDLE